MPEDNIRIPETEEEFRTELGKFVRKSYLKGVDVETGWSIYTDGETPHWNVEITLLVKKDEN